VFSVGPYTGNNIPSWPDNPDFPNKYIDMPDLILKSAFSRKLPKKWPIKDAIKKAKEKGFIPDIIFQIDADFYLDGHAPCPNVLYGPDPQVLDYSKHKKHADYFFVAHPGKYQQGGIWIPLGADDMMIDLKQPRPIDIVFAGFLYDHRKELFDKLALDFNLECKTNVILDDFVNFYNKGKIGISLSFRGDIPIRVFETMAMGCLCFADKADGLEELFIDGKHLVLYENENELTEKLKFYLNNPELLKQTALAGKEEVDKKHRTRHRINKIFEIMGIK
ncbi:MAG: glycosyltransferase, partial [bacterium]